MADGRVDQVHDLRLMKWGGGGIWWIFCAWEPSEGRCLDEDFPLVDETSPINQPVGRRGESYALGELHIMSLPSIGGNETGLADVFSMVSHYSAWSQRT